MKPHDERVLEANLAALMRRSYVPVVPEPAFRRGLETTWLDEVQRTADRRQRGPGPRPWAARLAPWAVAASLLAVVGAAYLLTRSGGPGETAPAPGREALVQSGAVALRGLDESSWRSASAAERAEGLALSAPGVELATPSSEGLRLSLADGTIELEALTHAAAALEEDGLDVRLEEGALTAVRADRPAAWRLGHLHLEHGRLRWERDGDTETFLLEQGAARHEGPAGTTELVARHPLVLVGGIPSGARTSPESLAQGDDPRRRAVDGESATAEDEGAPLPVPSSGRSGLIGRIVSDDEGETIPERVTVGLLKERVGNDIERSKVNAIPLEEGRFVWNDVAPATYEVFVHAEGRALLDLGRHVFEEGAVLDLGQLRLATGTSIRGYVVDAASGNAIAGASVLSETDAPVQGLTLELEQLPQWLPILTQSAGDGSFELEHVNPGQHALRISAPGYAPRYLGALATEDSGPAGELTVALETGGELRGRVERSDGTALAGGFLLVTPMNERPVMNFAPLTTDAEGRYQVAHLPAGDVLVVCVGSVQQSGPPRVKSVSIRNGETTVLDFLGERQGVRLFGYLLDAQGEPVAGKNLGLFAKTDMLETEPGWEATTSLGEGEYAFEGLAPGSYSLVAIEEMGLTIQLIAEIEVPDWPEYEFDAWMAATSISGQARDTLGGEALEGLFVFLELVDPDGTGYFAGMTRTDAQGRYRFRWLPDGAYRVTAYPIDGRLGFEQSETLRVDEASPRVEQDFEHQPGGTVLVRAVDSEGRAVEGAHVLFLDDRDGVFALGRYPLTDIEGAYTTAGVRQGAYRVLVTHEGHADAWGRVECRAGATSELTVTLETNDADDDRPAQKDESR